MCEPACLNGNSEEGNLRPDRQMLLHLMPRNLKNERKMGETSRKNLRGGFGSL